MTGNAVVTVTQFAHRYGKRSARDDFSPGVPARRMDGLRGPDGVGKSTLLGLIAGVRTTQQGTVHAFGDEMADAARRTANRSRIAYSRISYMPEGPGQNLYPTLSVFEDINFFGRLFGQSRETHDARIDEQLR
jgi:ribosome-dependent ATPase